MVEKSLVILKKLNIELAYDSAIPATWGVSRISKIENRTQTDRGLSAVYFLNTFYFEIILDSQ